MSKKLSQPDPPRPPICFWRIATVCDATGLSKTEIYRRIGREDFPASRKYAGTNKTFWISKEVLDWQRQQVGDDFDSLLLG